MKFTGLLLSGVLFSAIVWAQQGPRQGILGEGVLQVQALKNYLDLSDAQISDMRSLRASMRDAHRPLVQELAAKTKALREENQKSDPNSETIAALKERISALRDQIEGQRQKFQLQLRELLNQDQLASLDKLEEALRILPVARAAVAFDLIDSPDRPGVGRPGLRRVAGASDKLRRR